MRQQKRPFFAPGCRQRSDLSIVIPDAPRAIRDRRAGVQLNHMKSKA